MVGRTLDVEGRLTLTGARDARLEVRAAGNVLRVDASSLRALLGLAGAAGDRAARAARVTGLQQALAVAGIGVEINLSGVRFARLGAGTRGGPIARLLGLGPVRVDFGALLRALLARGAATPGAG